MAGRLRVTQIKSAIGYKKDQGVTLKALGLGKMWRTVEKDDTPSIRGMLNKVRHLVRVEVATTKAEPMARPPEWRVMAVPGETVAAAETPKRTRAKKDDTGAAGVDEAAVTDAPSETNAPAPAKSARRRAASKAASTEGTTDARRRRKPAGESEPPAATAAGE